VLCTVCVCVCVCVWGGGGHHQQRLALALSLSSGKRNGNFLYGVHLSENFIIRTLLFHSVYVFF
jgi:hypothetical protein